MADTPRTSTGIPKLDAVLSGGFPAKSTVILIGPPGVGKTTFLNQFIHTGIEEGESGLYLTLDNDPDEVAEKASFFGWDFDGAAGDSLAFIDGYSWREGEPIDAEFAIEGPSDLNQMNMTIADAMRSIGGGRKRVVMDSISTLILYTDANSAVKFLQVVSAKSKAANGCLLITLEEGVHDKKTVSTLNYVADGMIKMKMEGDDRYLSVSRMEKTAHHRDWMQFDISEESGITIVDED